MINKTRWIYIIFYKIVFVMIVLNLQTASSQETYQNKIKGNVYSSEGNPLDLVTITIVKENKRIEWTESDINGFFELKCPKGKYKILYQHINYKSFEESLDCDFSQNKNISVFLTEKSIQLNEILIKKQKSLTTPDFEQASKEHTNIPGGTNLIKTEIRERRIMSLKDALYLEPGVIIQEFFGANDQPRLNIRGSGIQSNPQRRGVYLLQDDIPVNFADGSYIIGVMDPVSSDYIEIFKGANALQYGSASLGGALNFISKTGLSSNPSLIKMESGSYDYNLIYGSYGKLLNSKSDLFFAFTYNYLKGYRLHNKNNKINYNLNYGYLFNNHIESRIFFTHSFLKFDIPGPLNPEQIEEDPTQINKGVIIPISMGPNIERDKPKRWVQFSRIANKTTYQISDRASLKTTFYYQYANDQFVSPIVLSIAHSYHNDLGLSVNYRYQTDKNKFRTGLIINHGIINRYGYINKNGKESFLFSKNKLIANNINLYAENNYTLTANLNIITSIQINYNERNNKDIFPNPEMRPYYSFMSDKYRYFSSKNVSLNQNYKAFNPRIGIIYNYLKPLHAQIYFNLSKSYEPPTFDELIGTTVTPNINTSPKNIFAIRLQKQTATTLEIGTRGGNNQIAWNISLYHSLLKNEILEFKDYIKGIKNTMNYPKSTHNGLELGIKTVMIDKFWSKYSNPLSLNLVYNYSNFKFNEGKYRNKKIAGIPEHYIAGEIEFKHHKGFFASTNVEWQPKKTPVDHENNLYQSSYKIYGFRIGYNPSKKWSIYMEGKNITNLRYASSYMIMDEIPNPPIPGFTPDMMTYLIPGSGKSYVIGLSYQF